VRQKLVVERPACRELLHRSFYAQVSKRSLDRRRRVRLDNMLILMVSYRIRMGGCDTHVRSWAEGIQELWEVQKYEFVEMRSNRKL